MRALLLVMLLGCAAEKSAENTGSAAPSKVASAGSGSSDGTAPASPPPTKTGIGGIGLNQGGGGPGGNGEAEDPCAGGRVTDSSGGDVVGAVSSDDIHRVIKQSSGSIKKCWDESLKRDSIGGLVKVNVAFTIEADGSVSKAEATGGPQGLTDCVAGVFKAMKFPAGGTKQQIRFPLNFSST